MFARSRARSRSANACREPRSRSWRKAGCSPISPNARLFFPGILPTSLHRSWGRKATAASSSRHCRFHASFNRGAREVFVLRRGLGYHSALSLRVSLDVNSWSICVNIAGTKPTAAIPARLDCGDLTVVGGAGYVGIPLVLAFAEAGCGVSVHDVNRDALAPLQSGRMPFIEHGGEQLLVRALKRSRLVFTSSPADVFRTGPVIITIGTPIDEFLNPVRKVVQDCIDALLPYLADGELLVLRSTVFPGTTDWLDGYLRRRNRHLKVAFCPERMVQGQGIKELKETPQIISGTTAPPAADPPKLFSAIAPELIVVKPREAQFPNLFSTPYRYIQFATSNQFYLIAKSAGLDFRKVYDAMKRNYPRARGIPSPGLAAGPRLVKGTMQLAAFVQNQFRLGKPALVLYEGLGPCVCADPRPRFMPLPGARR